MASKGLSSEEVRRAVSEAERDCILSSFPFTKRGWVYELIPPEDRAWELENRRFAKLHLQKWKYRRLCWGLKYKCLVVLFVLLASHRKT